MLEGPGGRPGLTSLALLRRHSVAHGEGYLSAIVAFMIYSIQQAQLTNREGLVRPILARPASRCALGAPFRHAYLPLALPLEAPAPPVRATTPPPATAALPPASVVGAATPTLLSPSPMNHPVAPLVVASPQLPPLHLHRAVDFLLGLRLRLKSPWLRSHPHTYTWRSCPWKTLLCKLRDYAYALCISQHFFFTTASY